MLRLTDAHLNEVADLIPAAPQWRIPLPLAFVKAEMAYHHVAQGDIAGEAYLVSF